MTRTTRHRLPILLAALAMLALSLSGAPVAAQDGSAPAAPTELTTEASHNSVKLTWRDPGDGSITHYQVLRRDRAVHAAGVFVTIQSNTGSADTEYTDSSAQPEKSYVYRIIAVNRHGASQRSRFARADTPAAPPPDPTPEPTAIPAAVPTAVPTQEPTSEPTPEPTAVPTAVPTANAAPTREPTPEPAPDKRIGSLTVTSSASGELTLTWSEPNPVPNDYRVIWAESNSNYRSWRDPDGNLYATDTSVTLTNLAAGTEYKVKVRARYGNDSPGPWSEEARYSTMAPPPTAAPTATAEPTSAPTATPNPTATPESTPAPSPKSVSDLTIDDQGNGSLRISWTPAMQTPCFYRVNWALTDQEYPDWLAEPGNHYAEGSPVTLDFTPGEYKIRVSAFYCEHGEPSGPWAETTHTVVENDLEAILGEYISPGALVRAILREAPLRSAQQGSIGDGQQQGTGEYPADPNTEYVWRLVGSLEFSSGWVRSANGRFGYTRELMTPEYNENHAGDNTGLHFSYNGVHQPTDGLTLHGGSGRKITFTLWWTRQNDHTVIDEALMGFEFGVDRWRASNEELVEPASGSWVQITDLSGLRFRVDEEDDSVGYYSGDPTFDAGSETWRRTFD